MSLEISNREAFRQLYQQHPQAWKDASTKFVETTKAASVQEIAKYRLSCIRQWVAEAVADPELKNPLAQKAFAFLQSKSEKGNQEQLLSPSLQNLLIKISRGTFKTDQDKQALRSVKIKLLEEMAQLQPGQKISNFLEHRIGDWFVAVDQIPINSATDRANRKKIYPILQKIEKNDPTLPELIQALFKEKIFDALPMPNGRRDSVLLEELISVLKAIATPGNPYQVKKQPLAGESSKPVVTSEQSPQKPAVAAAPAPQVPTAPQSPDPTPAPQVPTAPQSPDPSPEPQTQVAPRNPTQESATAPAPEAKPELKWYETLFASVITFITSACTELRKFFNKIFHSSS